ncbi:cell division control protein 73 [Nannizzia gypsea CBS 118893]|uniref:Cell division control protein 73 n=1 Tax=Arthroderma gypseum (strain ATCC MYA-4604 / CBS 118893) TaxID=535722 RepID=E4UQE9_ARTGP|nr:cell division control protein 73 [Nannizzia gypsea CBS 118893]EFR00019.1 cell division control protein 73 [Nannizzia gypsea CBS 118893]
MASSDPALSDPLLALKRALSSPSSGPVLTSSPDLSTEHATDDISKATHLYLTQPVAQSIPLSTPTRFVSAAANTAIDLRSIYFAWLKKDVAIPEYIASAQEVNDALRSAGKVLNLVFVEKVDLISWLEGASDESEYIKPLEGKATGETAGEIGGAAAPVGAGTGAGAAATAAKEADVAAGSVPAKGAGAVGAGPAGAGAATSRAGKTVDARLQAIYNGERKLGDRNTVLRGIKPTDFSHIRKTAEIFLGRNRSRVAGGTTSKGGKPTPTPGPGSIPKKPLDPTAASSGTSTSSSSSSRRPNPIILVSPSASSLLRMSNIKTFLTEGIYIPPDHPSLSKSTNSNLLHLSRTLQTIPDTSRSATASRSSDFKPDYWNRVVAVFTTGQTWQFKSYKWSTPQELFKHATGIHVGWRGEEAPREVKGWGRGVRSFAIDRWDEKSANVAGGGARWRDRGVVEGIWSAIEEGMKARGWGVAK